MQCEVLWLAFLEWAERRKFPVTLQSNTFSRMLHRVFPSIVTARPGIANNDDGRPRWFYGVRLTDGWRGPLEGLVRIRMRWKIAGVLVRKVWVLRGVEKWSLVRIRIRRSA